MNKIMNDQLKKISRNKFEKETKKTDCPLKTY